ncbi:EAL domain-containing protein [Methylotuvimicrobium buryatense]|nr:EAL domain-containing protein [Methylotuvimicrobium buryatense]
MTALESFAPRWFLKCVNCCIKKPLSMFTEASLDMTSDAIITVDAKGIIQYCNRSTFNLLNLGRDELIGRSFSEMVQLFNDKSACSEVNFFERFCSTEPFFDRECPLFLHRPDGSDVAVEDCAVPIELPESREPGALIVLRNISERKRAQDALDLSDRMFQDLLNFVPDALLIAEVNGKITLVNTKAARMFGYGRAELIGMDLFALIPFCPFHENRAQLLCGCADNNIDSSLCEISCLKKEGGTFPGEVNFGLLDSIEGRLLIAVVRDISQRKQFERQISYQTTHNELTRLPNRALLLERLDDAIVRARLNRTMVGLMFVDLDNFKNINDTLSHGIGDAFLCEIATRLLGLLPAFDELAHIGGDEFVLMFENVRDREELDGVAQRVLETIDQPCDIDDRRIQVSASIGITVFPDDGDDTLTLQRNADMAMYRAKEKGRNSFAFYCRDMHKTQQMRLEISNALRQALENREFELHYQPKLNLHTGRISSAEALIRWQHPEKGMIAPGFFIPLAEEYGLIVDIGAWVIDESCRQISQWRAEGMAPLRVSVNLSAGQCRRDDIYTRVMKTLSLYGVESKYLELEVTESMVLHDPEQALQVFRALSDDGVQIAIDDFGTGYSSFSYLRRFPSKALKIDKSFVDGLADDIGNLEIIRAIVSVAHNLGMRVVAEGVETIEQFDLLRDNGCDYIQGYIISRPVRASEIAGFIVESERRLWNKGV